MRMKHAEWKDNILIEQKHQEMKSHLKPTSVSDKMEEGQDLPFHLKQLK